MRAGVRASLHGRRLRAGRAGRRRQLTDPLNLDRRQVLAFRSVRHGLAVRRPREHLFDAVGAVGLRRTKHAVLALGARVDGFAPDDLAHALGEERLVVFYGARGTVMLAPPEDLPVLTIGTAPSDDGSLRAALPGA